MPAELLRSQGRKRYSDTNGRPPKLEEPDWDENGDPLWTAGGHADRMIAAILGGNHAENAARFAGITSLTWRTWRDRGSAQRERVEQGLDLEPGEARYFHFLSSVERADAQVQSRLATFWQTAAQDDWRATDKFMARRWPDQWGDRQRVEVTGADGGPVRVDPGAAFDEHIAQIAARLRNEDGDT